MSTASISVACGALVADVVAPRSGRGMVLFAHGMNSSRLSGDDRRVSTDLHRMGFGTCLIDLLAQPESAHDALGASPRLTPSLLEQRFIEAVRWVGDQGLVDHEWGVGCCGAGAGGAAALAAAAACPDLVGAVICRGGRARLAADRLADISAPVLFIAGGRDTTGIATARMTMSQLQGASALEVVPGAGPHFTEPEAIEAVSRSTREWCEAYLAWDGAP